MSHILAPPLASIYNASIREGYIPSLWKTATITPIPKKNPPTNLTKYVRPISLTPVCCKHLEKFVSKFIWKYVLSFIDKKQFGGLKHCSTVHALIDMMHVWYSETDDSSKEKYIRILFLDFQKAFDRINPNILLAKLKLVNIPDILVRWIAAFLEGRKQRVKIGNYYFDWLEVWGNVPQGTILALLLFLIMINDLASPTPTYKFVDDATLYEICQQRKNSHLQILGMDKKKPDEY